MHLAFSSSVTVPVRGGHSGIQISKPTASEGSNAVLLRRVQRRTSSTRAVLDESRVVAPATPSVDQWSPSSWRTRHAEQQPEYPDLEHLRRVERTLATMPTLVAPGEVSSLKSQLADVCRGNGFILQGGDCAEDLNESANGVKDTMRMLFKMAVVLMWGAQQPVIKIGRIAGQYGKPRSNRTETRNGVTLPVYRGEVRLYHSSTFLFFFVFLFLVYH